jgi:sulfoxide reductase heme-binding subunit YedZ
MAFDMALWEAIRAAGALAFALLSGAVVLGLCVRSRAADPIVKRGWVYEFHQSLSVAALVSVVTHVGLVLANSHVAFRPVDVLVPLASAWRPLAIAGGVAGLYLAALLVISSYIKGLVGHRAWRLIHYSSFAAWLTSLGHAVFSGSDTHRPGVLWLYGLSVLAVLCLLTYRAIVSLPLRSGTQTSSRRQRAPARLPVQEAADE